MNADSDASNSAVHYYDGDYPSLELSPYPENVDDVTHFQGVATDVDRYKEIAADVAGPILELCCGTGRVAIPLARAGREVSGVDISSGMLESFRANLERESAEVAGRVKLVHQDITRLKLEERNYPLAILAFNSLLCIPDFEGQLGALRALSRHLAPHGRLVCDIVNPLVLNISGDQTPKPFFTRRNPHNGNTYTRFAMAGPFDENHRQRLHGWYDEVDPRGGVKRQYYSVFWRPIFRFEIELMLREVGLKLMKIEGGHAGEPYTARSPRMFIHAQKADPLND